MGLVLGNPLGLLALLAVPAILLIHALQQRPEPTPVTTLFLLEALRPESTRGARWDRIRNSLPLWVQLAAALLATWLLVDPRFLREGSVQRVVVVLDSSASMSAFGDTLAERLPEALAAYSRGAARTEWILLDSDPRRGRLYAGDDRSELLEVALAAKPRGPHHDPRPALQAAQRLVEGHGIALFVTDHRRELPASVHSLAVGAPTDNVGFAGVRIERVGDGHRWSTALRNYGDREATREWRAVAGGRETRHETAHLAPGEHRILSGELADDYNYVDLALEPDAFALDDRLPILRPQPKRLLAYLAPSAPGVQFLPRLLHAMEAVAFADSSREADLVIAGTADEARGKHAVLFIGGDGGGSAPAGPIVPARRSIADELDWRGLISGPPGPLAVRNDDEVVLWKGERPLVLLRTEADTRQLLVNFDVSRSNAGRLPAFVVLLARFAESIRSGKPAFEADNVELGARLPLAGRGGLPERAPVDPGFFTIRDAGVTHFEGAAHFADVREADLREAVSYDDWASALRSQTLRNSASDPLRSIWLLALGVLIAVHARLAGGNP